MINGLSDITRAILTAKAKKQNTTVYTVAVDIINTHCEAFLDGLL